MLGILIYYNVNFGPDQRKSPRGQAPDVRDLSSLAMVLQRFSNLHRLRLPKRAYAAGFNRTHARVLSSIDARHRRTYVASVIFVAENSEELCASAVYLRERFLSAAVHEVRTRTEPSIKRGVLHMILKNVTAGRVLQAAIVTALSALGAASADPLPPTPPIVPCRLCRSMWPGVTTKP